MVKILNAVFSTHTQSRLRQEATIPNKNNDENIANIIQIRDATLQFLAKNKFVSSLRSEESF
jgi:hypothetical protein